jgi:hypothetical protein
MTDRETIFGYRMKQTEETLSEAVRMLESGFSPRSIVNRALCDVLCGFDTVYPLRHTSQNIQTFRCYWDFQ